MKRAWFFFLCLFLALFILGAVVTGVGAISGASITRIASVLETRVDVPAILEFLPFV